MKPTLENAAAWVRARYPELAGAELDTAIREVERFLRRAERQARAGRAVTVQRLPNQYAFNGLAGCVSQWRCRATGTRAGLYQSVQGGMECDPELPWTTVCEEHNTLVSHGTLAQARRCRDPREWCDDCRDADDVRVEAARAAEPEKV